ncbi:hypothetical protein [Acinetobacter nectaris]|nr:hypothetical protein [Acinetobacter nectaris]
MPCYTHINVLVNQYADAIIAFFEAIVREQRQITFVLWIQQH